MLINRVRRGGRRDATRPHGAAPEPSSGGVRTRWQRVIGVLAALALGLGGAVVVAAPAQAAEYGYGQWLGGYWHGSYYEPGSGFIYCLDMDREDPGGVTTTFTGQQTFIPAAGGVTNLSGNLLAGINWLISTHGQTADNATARAVHDAIWAVTSGYNPNTALGQQFRSQVLAYVAPPATATGSIQMTFQVDGNNNYLGTLRISAMSHSPASGIITLTNGVFTDTGTTTRAGSFSVGQTFPIRGVPPTQDGATYKIGASADLTANTGGGYAAQLGVWARGNFQRLGGVGGQVSGTVRIQGTALDPMDRSTAFFPTVATTVVTEALAPGDTFKDQLTFGLGDNGEGVVNEWPQGATGLYYPVVANCTVYGPFTDRPVQSTTVPAGAPVAGTFSATTTTADGPTVPYAVESSETMDEAGFYTAVCSIDYAEQALFTQNFLVEDYYFQDDFGQLVETSIVPFSVEVSTQLSTAEATVGASGLTDAITPRLTGGAWLRDGGTRVPVEVTGTWYWSATEPVQSASAPSDAEVLQVTSTTLAGPSVPVVAPAPQMPYRSGWVTVQWCVQPSVYVQAACDDYGVPAETVRLFGPEFSTSAPEEATPSDDISDTAIVTGPVPTAGVNLAYAAYHQADADAAAVCDATNLVFETSPVVITDPGSYDSEPLRIGLEHVGAIAWVLTVTAVDTGDVLFVGECGDPAEVTRVALPTVVTEAIKGGSVGGTIADVAIVEGPIPTNGVELSFAGYLQPDVDSEICDASTLVFESEELLLISQPGEYESEQFDVLEEHVGTVLWSETATIRDDEGAIVWQHVGECGLANETTFVLDVSTEATVRITAGEAAQDVAHVAGPIPDVQETGLRTELVFEAFAQGGSTTCAAEDLVFTTAADPIVVTDEGSFESPWSTFDQSGEVYWVASVRFIDEDTDEPALAHVGECGDPSEITVVELAFTGVAVTVGLWVGLFILLTGGVLFAVSRRRKVDTAA